MPAIPEMVAELLGRYPTNLETIDLTNSNYDGPTGQEDKP